MREMEINNKIMSGNEEQRFGKLNFLGDSIKDILFEENYLALLKEKIVGLIKGQIQQSELKKLIIKHGFKSVEEGKMSWGEGTVEDPTFTFSAVKKIG
ncbi:unnamed protein product, partial [marine sediment metagenome]